MGWNAQIQLANPKLKSNPYVSSALDLTSLPGTDISVANSEFQTVFSSFALDNEFALLDFSVLGTPAHNIDLSESFFQLSLKLVDSQGAALPENT